MSTLKRGDGFIALAQIILNHHQVEVDMSEREFIAGFPQQLCGKSKQTLGLLPVRAAVVEGKPTQAVNACTPDLRAALGDRPLDSLCGAQDFTVIAAPQCHPATHGFSVGLKFALISCRSAWNLTQRQIKMGLCLFKIATVRAMGSQHKMNAGRWDTL